MGVENETMRETLARVAGTEVSADRASDGVEKPIGGVDIFHDEEAATDDTKGEAPAGGKPAGEKPAAEKEPPAGEKPAAPKEQPAGAKPDGAKPTGEKPAAKPAQAQSAFRAPESWKPQIREQHWNKLPVPVQAEIFRREREIDHALKNSAGARKAVEQFEATIAPFGDVFRAEGKHPLQTISDTLGIMRTLKFAPAPQRAQMMAQVIMGFDVDMQMLDQALSLLVQGKPKPGQPPAGGIDEQVIARAMEKHLAPFKGFMENLTRGQQTLQAKNQQQMEEEITAFAQDPNNEYFEMVRDDMADILEMAEKKGVKMSLQDAYQRAILLHSDLAASVSKQNLERAAANGSSPAKRSAELSAASVTGSPDGSAAAPASDGTMRGDIIAAIAKNSGRG